MQGADLDLVVDVRAGEGVKALDVATGGGHVARRLREAGCEVVTVDSSPGMRPDVLSRAEELPFADGIFDVVVCRIAAHHFADSRKAVAEMARVSNRLVVIEDTLYISRRSRRRPSGCATRRTSARYTEDEWKELLTEAGLEVEQVEYFEKGTRLDDWLARTGCEGDEAARVRELLAPAAARGRHCLARHEDRAQGAEVTKLMAIIVDNDTRLVVQGLTGSEGRFHGLRNRNYGTNVVAGVTPGKGGQDVEGIPVFNTVAEAVAEAGANTTLDLRARAVRGRRDLRGRRRRHRHGRSASPSTSPRTTCCASTRTSARLGVTLIGPNCPGVLSPGKANVGIIPAEIFSEGNDRPRLALRHAHVPDRPRAHAARARQLDDRRHRRRSRRRLVLHRRPREVRGRSRRPSTSCSSARSAATRRRRRRRSSRSG